MALKQGMRLSMTIIGVMLVAGVVFPATLPTETVVKIGGTGSALGTMVQLAGAYEKSHPGVRIMIMPAWAARERSRPSWAEVSLWPLPVSP